MGAKTGDRLGTIAVVGVVCSDREGLEESTDKQKDEMTSSVFYPEGITFPRGFCVKCRQVVGCLHTKTLRTLDTLFAIYFLSTKFHGHKPLSNIGEKCDP